MSTHAGAMLRYFLLVLSVLAGSFGWAPSAGAQSSEGTDFWVGFTPNYELSTAELSLGISSRTGATVTVTATPGKASTAPVFTETFTLAANGSRLVNLPAALILEKLTSHLVDRASVHVVASAPVVVHARNWAPFTSDSFLALPTAGLGTEYVLGTWTSSRGAEAKVTATQDSTSVTFYAKRAAKAGDGSSIPAGGSRTLNLQRGETALFRGDGPGDPDLSGGRIVADKPVAVVAGNNCTDVPESAFACDYVAEMLPPVSALGQRYLLVPTKRQFVGDMIRVVAVTDDTAIYRDGALRQTLSKGETYEAMLDTPSELKSNRPVLVSQFLRGSSASGAGDPSEMLVVPTAQFMSSYLIAATFAGDAASTRFVENLLNVVIPTGAVSTLKLDGAALSASFFPIPGTSFSWAALSVSRAPHRIEAAMPFGLYAYGIGVTESYALPAGTELRTISDTSDPWLPNARLVQVGSEIRGLATDSSDTNANGLLDPDETIWGATIGPRSEDLNMNNQLDAGEDLNGNGRIDRDLGLRSIELAPDSANLALEVTPFTPGDGAVPFVVRRIDPTKDGLGNVVVTDLSGNRTIHVASLVRGTTIRDVRVREILSRGSTPTGNTIVLDAASFATPPTMLVEFPDRYEIEWFYPVASTLSEIDLSYDVTLKSPQPGENRVVGRELSLEYKDAGGNTVRYAVGQQSVEVMKTPLDFTAALDKAEYLTGENATLRVDIKNLGLTATNNVLCVRMRDSKGVDLFTPLSINTGFVSSGASTFVTRPLTLTAYFIGQYTVTVDAYGSFCGSGTLLKTMVLPLTIVDQPGQVALDSALTLDRAFYESSDRVLVDTVVRNLHPQRLAEGYALHVQIIRPDGTSLAPQSRAAPSLVPRNEWRASFAFTLAADPPGVYTALLQLRDANGTAVQTRSTNFVVKPSNATGFGLSGSLAATPTEAPIGSDVRFDYTLQNRGNSGYAALPLTLRVLNPATGALLSEVALATDLAAGATKTGSQTWLASGNVGDVLIAALSARVEGRDILIGQATFTLLPPQVQLTGTLAATPTTVLAGASVSFAYQIVNPETRAYTALPVKVRITKQGSAVVVAELPLTLDIPAGGGVSGNLAWATVGAQGDILTAQLIAVVAGNEFNLAHDGITLLAPDTGQYIAGTVAANVDEAPIGEPLSFIFTVRNQGPLSYTGLAVALRIVNMTRGMTAAEWTESYDLIAGASQSGNRSWVAEGSVGDSMIVRLVLTFAGAQIVLAEDAFTLKPPAVNLQFTQAVERASRVLALAACGEPSTPDKCDPARANALRALLDGLNVTHFVTNDASVFQTEMRSGEYATYWISGRIAKLDDALAGEVREAAHRGEALILDGVHDERNMILDAVGGVNVQGKLGERDQAVWLAAPVFGDKLLASAGRGLKLELAGGQVVGRFGSATGVPAVVGNTYGQGRALFLGLDLVASLAGEAKWPGQLDLGLGWVLPPLLPSYTPGAYVPVVMTVANAGQDVTVEVRTTLPTGAVFIAADPPAVSSTNPIVWRFPLATGAQRTLHLALSAPTAEGAHQITTEIGTVRNGVYAAHVTQQMLSIAVVSATGRLPAVQSQILALAVSTNEQTDRDKAAADTAAAQAAITADQWAVAIDELLSAIDWLTRITSIDVSAQRLALDSALKEAQWRWAESQ